MRSRIAGALCALVATWLLFAGAHAHEGHDHGAQPAAPASAGLAPRAETSSDLFELVAVADGTQIVVYLDRFATNAPVEGATVEVETPNGPVSATAEAGGPYRLAAPFVSSPGRHDLIFTVTAGDDTAILPLTLVVPERSPGNAQSAEGSTFAGFRLPAIRGPELWWAAAAFVLGLILGGVFLRSRAPIATLVLISALPFLPFPATAHEGHDHGDEKPAAVQLSGDRAQRLSDGSVFVPKPVQRIFAVRTVLSENALHRRSVELPGRVIPDPNASGFVQSAVGGRLSPPPGGFPRLGARVSAGDVLAYVTPPLQAIDVSDMRQRQGELDQQIAIVERRLARQEQLASSGAVSRAQLEETRLELQGLKERRAALEKARREPEALLAPVDGVIAEGTPVAGQIVVPSAIVFHVIDPAKLWVEALSFQRLAGVQGASAATAAGGSLSLSFRGSGLADRSQSVAVHFAIEGDTTGLRAGQFVTVLVTTGEETPGIAVPRGSLVRNANGQDFVYEHVAAERFTPRAVRTEPLDADRVLIAAGIVRGKRIVAQGAELLDHVR
jgi:hypothetical protein